jgi:protein-S-isoprenylcysteine O-methyltransferase Ste14
VAVTPFVALSLVSFQLIFVGRLLVSRRGEAIFLILADSAVVASGSAILMNPSFPAFDRLDHLVFMILLTIAFITSGFLPIKKVEVEQYGVAAAFVVSFFYEMFGFPLTLLVLDTLLEARFPLSGFPALKAAHLWVTIGLMDYTTNHLLSGIAIAVGTALVVEGHLTLHKASGRIVDWGIYRYVKHPQYIGIIVITGGMLIEYPTLLGIAMWAVLIVMYLRRAEQESLLMSEPNSGRRVMRSKHRSLSR